MSNELLLEVKGDTVVSIGVVVQIIIEVLLVNTTYLPLVVVEELSVHL